MTTVKFKIVNIRKLCPKSELQFLTSEYVTDALVRKLSEHGFDLDINHKRLDRGTVKNLKKHGIKVNCYTCDDRLRAERLVGFGVDYITTNKLEGRKSFFELVSE